MSHGERPTVHAGPIFAVTVQPRALTAYPLTDVEIDNLRNMSTGASLHLAFLGICVGAFLTTIVTVTTVRPLSALQFAGYTAAACVSGLASLYFGISSYLRWKAAARAYERIRSTTAISR